MRENELKYEPGERKATNSDSIFQRYHLWIKTSNSCLGGESVSKEKERKKKQRRLWKKRNVKDIKKKKKAVPWNLIKGMLCGIHLEAALNSYIILA